MAPEARYIAILPEGDIPEEELDYVENFGLLAATIEQTSSSEDITLLLSTCRNVWMTVNAVFVDLRDVIGVSEAYDRLSTLLFGLGRARPDRDLDDRIEDIGLALGQVEDKLRVWDNRRDLMDELEAQIADLGVAQRSRMRALIARQKETPPTAVIAHGRFLALNLDAEERMLADRHLCADVCADLQAIFALARALAGLARPIGELDRSVSETETLFTEDVEDAKTEQLQQAWSAVLDAVVAACERLQSFIEIEDPSTISADQLDITSARDWLTRLADAGRTAVAAARIRLGERFTPNVSPAPPMPPPYVVDLSELGAPPRSHGRAFEIERASGQVTQPEDTPRIALLRCGLAEDAYSHADPDRYVFGSAAYVNEVIDAARAAIDAAADHDCRLLAMPEVFVPQRAREELHRRATEKNLILICGCEYAPSQSSKPVNPVQISVPGIFGPALQLKQGPSKFELRAGDFAADNILRLFRSTAVGTFAVIVCSDLLEFDVVRDLADVEERLDLIVVCARSPNVKVFEGLAIADAARVYAGIAVVNARPDKPEQTGSPRKPATSDGTLIALPLRKELLPEHERVALDVAWSGDEPPSLALYDFPLKSIRDRDRESQGSEYLPPPAYILRRSDA